MNEEKKKVIKALLERNILLSPDMIKEDMNLNELLFLMEGKADENIITILSKEFKNILQTNKKESVNWKELEKSKVMFEKHNESRIYNKFIDSLKLVEQKEEKGEQKGVKIITSYHEEPKQRDVQDFVALFNNRYKLIERLMKSRPELENLTSISRIKKKREKEKSSIIGMILDKQTTKNGNLLFIIEDLTDTMPVLVSKNKPELFNEAKNIVLDEVIGITGVNGDNILFVNNIIWPETQQKEFKKQEEEEYCLFLSDLHVGSKLFLEENFNKFIQWLNLELGDENQKEIVKKLKYIFVIGDLIDGCGVYPGQESELAMLDVEEQYNKCAELLSKIPQHIKIILSPGNHDALSIAEPQPVFYKDFAKAIWGLKNATIVSNPALVNIGETETFQGFDVLIYHGYSFDYYVANVDSIREQGGYDRADLIMKFLLKRRHLAPSYSSTLYIPDNKTDPLFIEKEPDFFVTGHIHKTAVSNYKGITLISGSCWQSKTPFQEKVGHHPEPCRVPLANLKTREVKILKF